MIKFRTAQVKLPEYPSLFSRHFQLRASAIATWLLFAVQHARALTPDCDTAPHSFACKLDNALQMLEALAAVLGVGLLLVGIAAYSIYRKNKNCRLTPDD